MTGTLITLAPGGAQTVIVAGGPLTDSDPNIQSYVDRNSSVESLTFAYINVEALALTKNIVVSIEESNDGLVWFPVLISADEGTTFVPTISLSSVGPALGIGALARKRFTRLKLTPDPGSSASAFALLYFGQTNVSFTTIDKHIQVWAEI
jgi:hypothetical protein